MTIRTVSQLALCVVPLLTASTAFANRVAHDVASGPAILSGEASVTAQGGEAVTCAGREVTLVPDGAAPAASPVRRTICDSQGRFMFRDVAARAWIVRAAITWDVRAKQGIRHLGSDIAERIVLHPGRNAVVLKDQDLVTMTADTQSATQEGADARSETYQSR
jgi:hypothetical protein